MRSELLKYSAMLVVLVGCVQIADAQKLRVVTDAASAKDVSREVREHLLTKALPKMEALMRDEDLLDLPPGAWVGLIPIFRVQRYKAILAAGLGRSEELDRAIAAMRKEARGKPWEVTSEETIQKLGEAK